jgi:hypothetical protein
MINPIDDRREIANALQLALTEGEKFAEKCFDILVDEWGADKDKIDIFGLIEIGTGHLIACCVKGVSPTPYREFLASYLASDYGLSKMGLTRTQYEVVRK